MRYWPVKELAVCFHHDQTCSIHTHIYRRFAWQAWHELTSTVVLRGRTLS